MTRGMRVGALAVAVAMVTAVGQADAQPFRDWGFGATLSYEARVASAEDPDALADVTQIATAGVASRAFAGKRRRRLAYAAGFDFQFGGGVSGGFAYEFDLLPLGLAIRLGDRAHVGVVTGVGFSGLTGHIDFAMQFPVEAFLEFELGSRLRVMSWGSSRWVASSEARTGGVDALPFGDEFVAGVGVRWGVRRDQHQAVMGNGYYVGGLYQERLGVRFYGATIGYNLNVGTRRERREPRPYMPTVQSTDE